MCHSIGISGRGGQRYWDIRHEKHAGTSHTLQQRKLHQHPIHYISFCAEDKRESPCAIAYIARSKTDAKEHTCFVFYGTSDGQVSYEMKPLIFSVSHLVPSGHIIQSEDMSTTIGEAFELAFQHYQEAKSAQKDFAELKASVSKF